MRLDKETVSEARKLIKENTGTIQAAWSINMSAATLSDIAHDKRNVSRARENDFRERVGLSRLPDIVKLEVPDGYNVHLMKPVYRPNRKKRYSVPTDPEEAALYLADRMSSNEIEYMVEKLIEVAYTKHSKQQLAHNIIDDKEWG